MMLNNDEENHKLGDASSVVFFISNPEIEVQSSMENIASIIVYD